MLQDDNAPPHRSKAVLRDKMLHKIRTLPWPACSPDLNPIENVWDYIGRRLREMDCIHSINDLKQTLTEAWQNIPDSYIKKVIGSMTHRIGEVIKAKGGNVLIRCTFH